MLTLVITSRTVIMSVQNMFHYFTSQFFYYCVTFIMREKVKNLPVMKGEIN